jgi:metabolite-proton symporter
MAVSMPTAAPRSHAERRRGLRKVIGASLIGTSLEWYDFFLYGTAAALVFNKLFFPSFDPLVGTLLAFTTYAVGFVARPVGGVVFGHFGDRVGRRRTLIVTLMIMGCATVLIGCLPTYGTIGVAAPILLVTLRFAQGLGLGGEWGGAVLMVAEHGDERRRGLNSAWPQVGVPAGNLLAAGVLALLAAIMSDDAFLSWGWRVPFLLSASIIAVGLWIRLTVEESPLFREIERKGEKARAPLVEVVKCYPRSLAIAVAARFGTDVAFYTFALFILSYVTTTLGLPKTTALAGVLIGSAVQLLLIPTFGHLSDTRGRRPVYLAGAIGAAVWVCAFFPLLDTKSGALIVLAAVGGLVFHAAMYGPQAAFITELFGTEVRYSGASLGYQLAGVIGGALAPIISVALLDRFGSPVPIAIYVVAALVITVVAVLLAKETAAADLRAEDPEETAPRFQREPEPRDVRRDEEPRFTRPVHR